MLESTLKDQMVKLLTQAHVLIRSQLNLRSCESAGIPDLKELRCHSCRQLAACSWRHSSASIQALASETTQQLQRDFSLALMLIEGYQSCDTFPEAQQALAEQWLSQANQLRHSFLQTPSAEPQQSNNQRQ